MDRLGQYIAMLEDLVAPCVGRRLLSVVYGAIQGECDASFVNSGVDYIGGEVTLQFEGRPLLFLGWGENDGWTDHFSLAVQDVSTFKPNTLAPFVVCDAPEWRNHVGTVLLGVDCRGANDTPHALVFHFEQGTIVIGDGSQGCIGDGDDVAVLPIDRCDLRGMTKLFWSSKVNGV